MSVDINGNHVPFLVRKLGIRELRLKEGAVGDERVQEDQGRQVRLWHRRRRPVAQLDTVGEREELEDWELHLSSGCG